MGLDITVHGNVQLVRGYPAGGRPDNEDWDWADTQDLMFLDNEPVFASRGDGMEAGFYSGERHSGFRAGSYSGYNAFRRLVCNAALDAEPERVWNGTINTGRLVEWINFTDCDGFIGPKTAGKLAADCAKVRAKVDKRLANTSNADIWLHVWNSFRLGFRYAAENNGVVRFH